ncbi:mannose-6-phosphate isomerase [Schizosaccharomyces cryophilus OY26]|uniref:Mannose-6-phosphate isomerase n=1 Tax=Schizosaccharomyces cryophilus (strain OY26 / ATCC MYA-4695 / CBS 11777 / NBRC 106824 / NRRL Y48691) TaxID=653667 RepID=S9X967_SCHCR|nr:mannose-6-phosphate isomerase [Schizosaccharomyces cryophilus OY26]EPY53747.1 mannose-6-phosphate isomerase [Schizosaccharomyces cryophilus OY26]
MYRLKCQVMDYDWGRVGHDSLAAQFAKNGSGFDVKEDKPYAELWMGSYHSGPSIVMQTGETLDKLLTPETMGQKIYEKYGNQLPFLFKVLSINKVLSLQAHPDKKLGKELHANDPKNYKDDNHKPEMALALTEFQGLCGFRHGEQINSFLKNIPPFREFVGEEAALTFENEYKKNEREALRELFNVLMSNDNDKLEKYAPQLVKFAKDADHEFGGKPFGGHDLSALILRLNGQYPNDIGLFITLLLNHVNLKPGESIFLRALDPHAYIAGNIVECMASSDNVIRSGFTSKFKDKNTLVKNLTYETGSADDQLTRPIPFPKAHGTGKTVVYKPPIEEFNILQTTVAPGQKQSIHDIQGPSILIVVEGNGLLHGENGDIASVAPGFVFFVSANYPLTISSSTKNMVVYQAYCE